jgi:hypothetical protein
VHRATLRVAIYRFRANVRRRWGGSLTLAPFIAVIGALAMASTDPADLRAE